MATIKYRQAVTGVSTISDIQGDTAHDTNSVQHTSIPFEYDMPDHAADSWKEHDDTTVEHGTENTQTD